MNCIIKLLLTSVLLFSFSTIYSQDLKCKDFKKGTFTIPRYEDEVPRDYKIIRKKKYQIEELNGKKIRATIKWLNKCSYVLIYNSKKSKDKIMDEDGKFFNKNGGLKVEIYDIKRDTAFFNTTLTVDNQTFVLKGKMIKLN